MGNSVKSNAEFTLYVSILSGRLYVWNDECVELEHTDHSIHVSYSGSTYFKS